MDKEFEDKLANAFYRCNELNWEQAQSYANLACLYFKKHQKDKSIGVATGNGAAQILNFKEQSK